MEFKRDWGLLRACYYQSYVLESQMILYRWQQ